MSAVELGGLGKGANAPINGRRCTVTIASAAAELDVLAFQLGDDGRVRSDGDVVFYNQPESPEGAVLLSGPGTVTVSLAEVPAWVEAVTIAVAVSGDDPTASLPQQMDVTLSTEVEQFRCSAGGLTFERAAVLVELYRRNGSWKLRNVSAGWEQGLTALFTHHGVTVDEGGATAPTAPAGATPVHPQAPPSPTVPPTAPTRAPPAALPPISPPRSRTRRRIAWSAATVIALLVLAAVVGRASDAGKDTGQLRAVAAPAVSTVQSSRVQSSTGTAPVAVVASSASASASASAASTSSSRATTGATAALLAPALVAVVRDRQSAQAAVTALQDLRVAGRAPKTGYSRARFGNAWTDDVTVDGGHNGCDTRNDILRRDLQQFTVRTGSHGCAVTAGTMTDPYTGRALQFSAGRTTTIQIDHVVALSDAWQTGAAALSAQRRQDLANDPMNLQATASAVNQAKSDGDAATWLPPDKSYRCTYVARQVAVKQKYALWVTAAERQAISTVLTTCGATAAAPLPRPTSGSTRAPAQTRPAAPPVVRATNPAASAKPGTTSASPTTAAGQPPVQVPEVTTTDSTPTTTTHTTASTTTTEVTTQETVTESTTAAADAYYENCAAARAAGAAPLRTGDPGYRAGLDRDGDGIACE